MCRQTGAQPDWLSSALKTRDISRRGIKKIPGQRAGEEFTETNTLVFDGQFIRHVDTRLTHGFDYLRDARIFNAGTQQLAACSLVVNDGRPFGHKSTRKRHIYMSNRMIRRIILAKAGAAAQGESETGNRSRIEVDP
jgi:hypothetical protein